MSPKVQQFFMKLPPAKREAAMQLRDIIVAVDNSIEETIKWNQLTFVHGKTNLAFIYTFATVEYINLGFFHGTMLKDPKKLLEGTGKGMRHVKIYNAEKIPAKQIAQWIKESMQTVVVNHEE